MAFDFGSQDDSSDDAGVADLSAWQTGTVRKRSAPPRRTSGFQAVNQLSGDEIAMQATPEPAPAQQRAPTAQMQPNAEPTVISSGEEFSSDEEEGEEEEAQDAPAQAAPIEVEETDDDIWAAVDQVVEDFDALEEPKNKQQDEPVEQEEVEDSERSLSIPTQTLEVFIPHDEIDDAEREECIDFTAGGDVVRRVISELQDEQGMMAYTVEFEDYHVEKVSLACDFTSVGYISIKLLFSILTRTPTSTHHTARSITNCLSRFYSPNYCSSRKAKKR